MVRYSKILGTSVPVEDAPLPPAPDKRQPWWASWVLALIPALGLGGVGAKLIERSDKQLELLTGIRADVARVNEKQDELKQRVDGIEDRERRKLDRDERIQGWAGSALEQEGYKPPRGLDTDQVRWQTTRNAKRPLKPVEPDGSDLEVPDPPRPPVLK